MLAACEQGGPEAPPEQPEDVLRAPGVPAHDVGPSLEGHTIRVAGEVVEVLDDRTFVLAGESLVWHALIPVVARTPVFLAGLPLEQHELVVVTGVVRTRLADVERELGRRLPPRIQRAARAPGTEGAVLVAREVRRVGGTAAWTNP